MKFIKLTERKYSELTYFNLAHVLSFYKDGDFTTLNFGIYSDSPNKIQVKETPEQILQLIKEGEND